MLLAACGHSASGTGSQDAARGRTDATKADAGHDAGARDAASDSACQIGGDGGYVTAPYEKLSQYCIATIADGGIALSAGVTPYDLNTPLFSDYAVKVRGVWLPPGTQAVYSDGGVFEFPPGSILTKSFGFADDMRKANPVVTWIETRLVISTNTGYYAYTYIWDSDGKDATLSYAGEVTPLTWIDGDGGTVTTNYLVPSYDQCKQCHNADGVVLPIGPKARQLNRTYEYADGGENQIAHWTRVGILSGAPDASAAPKLPVWDDPTTGTVEERARAYLEGNCAHCHNAEGTAFTTGLFLLASETDTTTFGVCKPPVAAGPATGNDDFDIVPGQPDASVMVYRISSDSPGIAMPQIERSVVDVEGVALITQWIAGLDGGCGQ